MLLMLLLLASAGGAWAQVGSLTIPGDETVCINTSHDYGVVLNPLTLNYTWSIRTADGTSLAAGGTITPGATPNLISVLWTIAGTYTLRLVEDNLLGCPGPNNDIHVTVNPDNTIALTSAVGTDGQTVCINTPIINIVYATTGATGATFSGLPAGVTGSWLANVVTITGTPSVSGPFPYTITLTGGCGTVTKTGTITVTPLPVSSPIWHN